MHEMSIAMSIVEIVNGELESLGITKNVEKIIFRAGILSAIVPQSLQFNFDILKSQSERMKNATLEIIQVPLTIRCTECGDVSKPEIPAFVCPRCGKPVEILEGHGMKVESVVVEE